MTTQNNQTTKQLLEDALDERLTELPAPLVESVPFDASFARPDGQKVAVLIRNAANPPTIDAARRAITRGQEQQPDIALWLLQMPRAHGAAARQAKALGINWIDQTGDAEIVAPGLKVRMRLSKAAEQTKSDDAFQPKSPNVRKLAAALLDGAEPGKPVALGGRLTIDAGQVSRMMAHFERAGLIGRDPMTSLMTTNTPKLLHAMVASRQAEQRTWARGELAGVAATEDAVAGLWDRLTRAGVHSGVLTGPAGIDMALGKRDRHDTAAIYIPTSETSADLKAAIGFTDDPQGRFSICVTSNAAILAPTHANNQHEATDLQGLRRATPARLLIDADPDTTDAEQISAIREMALSRRTPWWPRNLANRRD